jgi:hypothetical protein
VPIRFHLDEHISARIAAGLRRRHIDVTTAAEAGLAGADDDDFRIRQLSSPALPKKGLKRIGAHTMSLLRIKEPGESIGMGVFQPRAAKHVKDVPLAAMPLSLLETQRNTSQKGNND